jgi:hypothetical protein
MAGAYGTATNLPNKILPYLGYKVMNNSLGKTQVVISAEQPIEGLGPQGERACALSSWALASHSTKSARGLDSRQKRARLMGAASCAT